MKHMRAELILILKKLEDDLGVKVFPTIATRKQGVADVIDFLKTGDFPVSNKISPSVIKMFKDREMSNTERIYELLKLECSHLNTKECEELHNERIDFVNSALKKSVVFNAPKNAL